MRGMYTENNRTLSQLGTEKIDTHIQEEYAQEKLYFYLN